MAKSLNKVQLIGRLGGDPEMRTTGTGMQVVSFSVATNRQWTAKDGSLQEETDWHSIIAWERLAQICHEHLSKGRLVYIEGRLHTRSYEANGQKQYRTEIVASDMVMLDAANAANAADGVREAPAPRNSREDTRQKSGATVGGRGRFAGEDPLDEPDDVPF